MQSAAVGGVGFQINFFTRPLLDGLERAGARIDYLEILCDTVSGSLEGPHLVEPRHAGWLADLQRRYPLVAHSNFGEEYGFAELDDTPCVRRHVPIARAMDAAWMTDHMFYGTQSTSYLWSTPIQFSAAEIQRVAARARRLQDLLGMPLLHENAFIYALFPGSDLGEAEFLSGLVEQAGTHLLLDVHNLYANSINFAGADPWQYVDRIPLDRVLEIHVAGGQWIDGWYHDLHNDHVPEPVWELVQHVLERSRSVRGVTLEVQGPVHTAQSRPIDAGWHDMALRDLERIAALWSRTRG